MWQRHLWDVGLPPEKSHYGWDCPEEKEGFSHVRSQGCPQAPQAQKQNSSWHQRHSSLWGAGPLQFCSVTEPLPRQHWWLGDTTNEIFLLHCRGSSSWNIYCSTRKGRGEAGVGHSSSHTAQLTQLSSQHLWVLSLILRGVMNWKLWGLVQLLSHHPTLLIAISCWH